MIHLKIASICTAIIRYPIVCSKWMSSTDAVIQEHPACLSAEFRQIRAASNIHHTFDIIGNENDLMHSDDRKQFEVTKAVFLYSRQNCPCFPTRQAGCGVHPFQQLSHTQLPTVVGVTWEHNLTHLHLSRISVSFLTPLDGDGALDHVRFIFGCHHSATWGKCKNKINKK